MDTMIVETNVGKIQGIAEETFCCFKGIPYAKAPVGELRWRPPQKREPFEGVFQAVNYGNRSAQNQQNVSEEEFYGKEFYCGDKEYDTPISEDSLFLNIWTPREKKEGLCPVAVYIHGGAWQGGCGHEMEFRTDAYAKRGVILVTINYRLNVFGFLAHPDLLREDAAACGNYGILDQIAALDWIGENIEAFGGDPGNITIFGQSAGGMSVQTLLSTPYAQGKFAKAIIQSGGGYPYPMDKDTPMDVLLKRGERVLKMAGVSTIEELRKVPMDILLGIAGEMMGLTMYKNEGIPFLAAMNGRFRTEYFDETTKLGKTHNVPVMIGSNKNDIFVSPEEAAACDSQFNRSCQGFSLAREAAGQIPAYVYYFQHDLPGDEAGAFHSAELWYTHGTLKHCWRPMTEEDQRLSDDMVGYWTNFMKSGNPNGEGLVQWKLCTREEPFVMCFQ